ncbi:hypothetical protein K466DRAFT_605500 [Polyporus arcularius HHB13444]|uniref:Uncharacterized protein n=1 Tax=Polyporus arcularius HHB13444 TaxID=1314778 RepID=A0A5C3P3C1_9APHY|nr:hypothetical protein K466DRAFT_605500 [Polyporus arcularius HHB13444]
MESHNPASDAPDHRDPTPDLTTLLFVLESFLGAAARVFGGGRIPDIVHLTEATVRMCLEAPCIRDLPFEQRRDVVRAITSYMLLLALPPQGASTAVERTISAAAERAQGRSAILSDAWASPQGVLYAPAYQSSDSEVFHVGMVLHPHAREVEVVSGSLDDSDSEIPELVDLD